MEKKETEKTTLSKNKEGYGYKYTDLAEIHKYLEENGMKYYQTIEVEPNTGNDYIMTYRFINGKWEDEPKRGCRVVDATLSGKSNPAQEQGSALTYARRYSLLMAFGLATDDDDAEALTKKETKKILATPKQVDILENNCTDEEKQKIYDAYSVKSLSELPIEIASKLVSRKLEKEKGE